MPNVIVAILEHTLWMFRFTTPGGLPRKMAWAALNTAIRLASIVALIVAIRFALACPIPFL